MRELLILAAFYGLAALIIRAHERATVEEVFARVSPIRAEDRDSYPADWPQISERIRTVRAGGRCECKGQCGRGHRGRCRAWNGRPHPDTRSMVVLTVAHLNHTPEDCRDENLCAMCQACHLSYDAEHHAATRARTRHAAQTTGMAPLFDEEV